MELQAKTILPGRAGTAAINLNNPPRIMSGKMPSKNGAKANVSSQVRKNLECHHLDGWNSFPNRRHDVSNGALLKKRIHKMFHDANSYGNNREDQFEAFLFNCFGLDWQKMKADLQHGNHQPSSLKSLSPDILSHFDN